MELTANISGLNLNLASCEYVKNDSYTEDMFKESLLKQLKHEWKSYLEASHMLQDLYEEILMNYIREDIVEKTNSILESQNLVRDAFLLKLTGYLLAVAPEWMKGVASLDFNQSSGVFDIWKYDKDGKLIDEKPYTIENW